MVEKKYKCKEGSCIDCNRKKICKKLPAENYWKYDSSMKKYFFCKKRNHTCSSNCQWYNNCNDTAKRKHEKWKYDFNKENKAKALFNDLIGTLIKH